jgi:DegV family protein with EDD domain
MNIALSAETTVDLQEDLLTKYQIATVPYTLMFGEKAQFDGVVVGKDLFKYTNETGKLAKTSCVNLAQFQAHFRKLLEQHDYVIHFSLSSEMSASYANAVQAAKEFSGKVAVMDSRTLSTGIALQSIYARKLIDAGYPLDEVVKRVNARIPATQASFGLEAVNYLYKGGRCSALSALGANILHIRPQIIVKDGKMISGKKFRGPMEKWVMDYVETTLQEFNNPDYDEVFITYSSAPDNVVQMVRERLEKAGFKHIMNTYASGTVSCHCGPHTLGILYFNDGPHPVEPFASK